MVGLEDELVALLEQEAECGGADELQERQPPTAEGGRGGTGGPLPNRNSMKPPPRLACICGG